MFANPISKCLSHLLGNCTCIFLSLNHCFKTGLILPPILIIPKDICQYPETFLLVTAGQCYWHLLCRDHDATKHPTCTEQTPTTEAYPVQKHVNSAKVEKPWPRTSFPFFWVWQAGSLKSFQRWFLKVLEDKEFFPACTYLYHCFHFKRLLLVCLSVFPSCIHVQIPPQGHCFADMPWYRT